MFEEIFLESTRNVALRISVKIVETTANYYHSRHLDSKFWLLSLRMSLYVS